MPYAILLLKSVILLLGNDLKTNDPALRRGHSHHHEQHYQLAIRRTGF